MDLKSVLRGQEGVGREEFTQDYRCAIEDSIRRRDLKRQGVWAVREAPVPYEADSHSGPENKAGLAPFLMSQKLLRPLETILTPRESPLRPFLGPKAPLIL